MACILYRKKDNEVIEERVPAQDVAFMLENGYVADPDDFKPKRKKKVKEEVVDADS